MLLPCSIIPNYFPSTFRIKFTLFRMSLIVLNLPEWSFQCLFLNTIIRYIEVLTPVSVDMTLFKNRILHDIIKLG